MEKINLKITSDGTSEGTIIQDQDGRTLESAIDFSFQLDTNGVPVVKLTLVGVPVEINYAAETTSLEKLDQTEFEQVTVVFKPAPDSQQAE